MEKVKRRQQKRGVRWEENRKEKNEKRRSKKSRIKNRRQGNKGKENKRKKGKMKNYFYKIIQKEIRSKWKLCFQDMILLPSTLWYSVTEQCFRSHSDCATKP